MSEPITDLELAIKIEPSEWEFENCWLYDDALRAASQGSDPVEPE